LGLKGIVFFPFKTIKKKYVETRFYTFLYSMEGMPWEKTLGRRNNERFE